MTNHKAKEPNCKCVNCGKKMYKYPSVLKHQKTISCSRKCRYEHANKEKYRELSLIVGQDLKTWLKKKYYGERMSTTELAKALFGKKEKQDSIIVWMDRLDIPRRSISEAMTGELNNRYGITGEAHPNYDFNISDEERIVKRNYREYNEFRKSVYERDNYTCQICNDGRGGNLVCHHLNGYHWDKGGRVEPDNGVTLCEACHNEFHSVYGKTNNNLF